MFIIDFLKKHYIDELGDIIKHDSGTYLKFILIAQGIEFLGACMDNEYDFGVSGQSGKRFKQGLSFFPPIYRGNNLDTFFWKKFRNGLMHQTRTEDEKFRYAHREPNSGLEHLKEYDGSIVLILEDFYDDFVAATYTLINGIENKTYFHPKLGKEFIKVKLIEDVSTS